MLTIVMTMGMRLRTKGFIMEDYFDSDDRELRSDLEVLGDHFFDLYYTAFHSGKINPDVKMAKATLLFFEESEDYDKCVELREYIKEREEYERSYRPS